MREVDERAAWRGRTPLWADEAPEHRKDIVVETGLGHEFEELLLRSGLAPKHGTMRRNGLNRLVDGAVNGARLGGARPMLCRMAHP